MRRVLLLLAVLIIPACGGSSDSGFAPAPPPSPLLPSANVPENFKVLVGTTNVSLDGSKSFDPVAGAPALTYFWEQTAGPTATLVSAANVATLVFNATAVPATLTFRLTVTGAQGTDSASVTVSVKTFIVTATDSWFLGFGKPWTLTATAAGGTGPYNFQWTGTEAWLGVPASALTTVASVPATNSLSGTTPLLTDFQTFPDLATVGVIERTTQGRLQLKVSVTDTGTGNTDEDLVNFSVGPFADPVANENVALGEPIFFNGGATNSASLPAGTITNWAWSVNTVPGGSAVTTASLKKADRTALGVATDQRFVYVVPDKVGDYTITVTQVSGAATTLKIIDITCGKYVGVGGLTGKPPDPNKGECASCHGGQVSFLADFAGTWKQTAHAHVMEEILDPVDPFYAAVQVKGSWLDAFNFGSEFSIDSRNVGWSRPGPNPHAGWAERATNEKFVLKGATWPELVRKNPFTAALSNVQCESCHGPGSEHAGDTTGIRKSYDSNVCGRCHAEKFDHWSASSHGKPPIASPASNASCNGCHTAQGFVVEMRAQEGADPHPVLFGISNINRPVLPAAEQRGTTCQTCHEPHKKTVGRPASDPDPQLRSYGNVKFRNNATVNAGPGADCFMCHQSRTDTRSNSPDMNVRRAPHDSTAAEMLTAKNGQEFAGWIYNSSPHGITERFVKLGSSENRQCLSCHLDVAPGPGAVGYGALGGHTFNVTQGDGNPIADQFVSTASTAAAEKTFLLTAPLPPSLLRKVFPGDSIVIDGVPNTVRNVDNARQLTLANAPVGGPATTWSITSVKKYNVAACLQCHATIPLDLQCAANGDYDGDLTPTTIQGEIAGLQTKLLARINQKLNELAPGFTLLLPVESGRIKYRNGSTKYTFPGPNVPASENPTSWASVVLAGKDAEWLALYEAAYNYVFVLNDKSEGIHNTGYAVNLLQSSFMNIHLVSDPVSGPPPVGSLYVPR